MNPESAYCSAYVVDNKDISTTKAFNFQPSVTATQSRGGVAEMADFASLEDEQMLDASAVVNPTFSDKLRPPTWR